MGTTIPTASQVALLHPTPPLLNGDRLTRDEFERRNEAMPELEKAELIEGVVYVPSPVALIWRVWDREIDWFVLKEGRYDRLALSNSGIFTSTIFPGLWLDPHALIDGDLATVLRVVQQALTTTEHKGFVARLQPIPTPRQP